MQSDPTARPPPLDDAAHLWRAYGEEAAYTVSHVTSGAAQMLMVEVLAQMARAFNASSGGDGAKPEGLSPADGSLPDMSKVGLGPHAIANFGDTSYCTGYLGCWLSYLEQWQYATMTVPYLPGPGNHEWDAPGTATVWNGTDSGGECGVPASVLFPAPGYIARGGLQSPVREELARSCALAHACTMHHPRLCRMAGRCVLRWMRRGTRSRSGWDT